MTQLILFGSWVVMFIVALFLSRKEGNKAAQLEALKKELKQRAEEQERANKITDNVNAMSDDDVRKRLSDISSNK